MKRGYGMDQPNKGAEAQNCTGCFLVASPYLADGHFFRSVVFIVRHTDEGAFGVVINRVSDQRFSDAVEMSDPSWAKSSKKLKPGATSNAEADAPADASASIDRDLIHLGGPVEGPLIALHEVAGIGEPCGVPGNPDQPHGTETILNDHPAEAFGSMSIQYANAPAWMTTDEDHLRILFRREDARLKFIVGYSGWGKGQLEDELKAGGWLVTPAESDSIFDGDGDIWEKLVKRCGHAILKDLRPDLSLPAESEAFDPGLN
ncbi:YqgE/AlgH family protein [Neorhodopirellula lusitana]|uniref:YqgE/AlgH family protein n=1 Tax=Neorhodopirellula lusitana TaxID=445327 RepID=UPI00384F1EA0